ncbi:MAG: N-acetyltransferase [Hyphomicrobiales bacterium]|nr:N-acetyltransferase [Hyphomicrobiales bacterium]
MSEVVDNKGNSRFELDVDGEFVIAEYRIADGSIFFTHTETPYNLRGRGLAAEVVKAAVESARARGLKVVPRCSYVAHWLKDHPEYQG